MSYKIAIGSSDGIHVDLKFGEVKSFLIYEVNGEARLLEERSVIEDENENSVHESVQCGNKSGCGETGTGCGNQGTGCGGQGTGCGGSEEVMTKVSKIADCRCVVCKKVGFQAQKQFEKKAISVFDVECPVAEALEKISFYYNKIDNHESFSR